MICFVPLLSLLLSLSGAVHSWTANGNNNNAPTRQKPSCSYRHDDTTINHDDVPSRRRRIVKRRDFLSSTTTTTTMGFLLALLTTQPASSALLPSSSSSSSSVAAVVFDDKFTVADAKKRFQLARKDMQYLLDNYSDITQKGGGDAVRNYLGTQGVTSNMYGIQKVLKLLQQESEDIVEYTETMDDFNAYFYQAEGAAYQSMFAQFSSASITPEALLATAKKDIETMMKYMDQLALQLKL
jgi:hypothetical protein